MNENFYREIVKQSPFAYFCCKSIKKDNGETADFIISDINYKLQEVTGLEEESILGRSVMDIMASSNNGSFSWFAFLQDTILKKNNNATEQFIQPLNGWAKVQAFAHADNYIVVQFIEVRKEEPFTRVLIDSLPFTAWAKDKEGRYISVNRKYEEDSSMQFEEIKGKSDADIWPHELAMTYIGEDNEVIEHKKVRRIHEFNFRNEWYKTYKSVVCDEKGDVVGTIGFSINIDEEKRIKSEIVQQKRFLTLVLDSIPDFIFYKDINGIYVGINDSAAKMYFNKTKEEIIGKSDSELNSNKVEMETFVRQDKEVLEQVKVNIYEESLRLFDGTVRDYETIKAPFFDENDRILGVFGISRDITQRRVDEKKLKESEEKFRQLAENIEGVFSLREKEKVIYLSPAFEKVFGRNSESIYNDSRSFIEIVHPEDRGKFMKIDNKMGNTGDLKLFSKLENKQFYNETFRIIKPDGGVKWIWTKEFPIKDEEGNVVRIVSVSEDITAIKEAEMELERIRTEFFANLSHEFRTPLNLIFSSLQMVELKLKGCVCENESYLNKYMNIIKQNNFRLLRLVNNLIDSTKIDAGYVEYCPENHDIAEYIKNIYESVAAFAKTKDMELTFDSKIQEKIIAFDLDKIERIMLNLLSNAIKFNIPGGKIGISLLEANKFVEIHVRDTGIGIPEDKLSYIFERFKQVNNRLTKVSEGSGIGLSLAKSLVEMHGGTIEAKSTFGRGTEFIIRLPDTTINEAGVGKNQLLYNSSVERINIEFSDIYGLNS